MKKTEPSDCGDLSDETEVELEKFERMFNDYYYPNKESPI
jgi:hypothetical protein